MPRSRRMRLALFLVVAFGVTGCDQVSKWHALGSLTTLFEPAAERGGELHLGEKLQRFLGQTHPPRKAAIAVHEDFWHLRYTENPGAAWSLLRGLSASIRVPLLLGVACLAMLVLLFLVRRTRPEQVGTRMALALILGGALGNFLDRLRLGYVIDFIHWHFYDRFSWPIFNIADVALTAGAALALLTMLREGGAPGERGRLTR